MRVLIAGGGIGGMATAVAMRREGLEPVVLEQAPAITEVGAGIGMSANAMRVLDHLGAGDHVRDAGLVSDEMVFLDLNTDERLLGCDLDGPAAIERYGGNFYPVHRADLLESLHRLLPPEVVRVNSKVVSFKETPDEVVVQLAEGDELRGDLLIGADGLKSAVREGLFGVQEPHPSGVLAWRGLFAAADAPHIPVKSTMTVWIGPGRYVIFFPVRSGAVHNFVGFVPANEVHRESWTTSGDVDDLRRSFVGACKRVTIAVEAVQEAFVSSIVYRDPLAQWSTDRVTLLGDAAHPAPPTAGQGAAMAIEDAVTLGACLRRHGPGEVTAALREYEARRRPRATRYQVSARSNDRFMREADPALVRARNGRFRGLQRLDPDGETLWRALYAFDAVTAAERPVEAIRDTKSPLRRDEAIRAFELWRTALTSEDLAGGWLSQRAGYERFLARVAPVARDLTVERIDCDGVSALKATAPGGDDGPVVLHLHGGGFTMGSAHSAAGLAGRLAIAVRGTVVVPDYRLAPEHGYPAGLDDARRAWQWLVEANPKQILVTGEEAGGGLGLALAVALRDAGERLPDALWLVSPLCDLTISAPSIDAASVSDPWHDRDRLVYSAASYIQDTDPRRPLASPLFAEMRGLPPMLLYVAEGEALHDDAVRVAAKAANTGVEVVLRTVPDSVHAFALFDFLPETAAAIDELAEHVAGVTQSGST
jgi:salicylate hydroxylase